MTEQWQELKETITEMRDNGGTGTQQEVCKFLANYMEILEKQMQQSCKDCISREATIEAIYKKYIGGKDAIKKAPINDLYAEGLAEAVDAVWEMPSVQPTIPTGYWIEKEDYNLDTYYECSECGADYCIEGDILIHKYCPNCGARMQEEEE